jgi:DNA end-binding protein Ku
VARPLWKGSISFGLVNVPVRLYKATRATSGRPISFHQIHASCGTRIQYRRWCPTDEREVPWDEIEKGYEYEKGRYAIIAKDELAALPRPDEAVIAIESFVELGEVDPIYFDRAYYVAPDGVARAYGLLLQVMAESRRVALARMALRTRGHLALVRAAQGDLILHTMFYPEELSEANSVPGRAGTHVTERELAMAQKLVESMAGRFEPAQLSDDYTARLREMIEQKVAGQDVVESPIERVEGGRAPSLMDALKRSLSRGGPAAPGSAAAPADREAASLPDRGPARPRRRVTAGVRSRSHGPTQRRRKAG